MRPRVPRLIGFGRRNRTHEPVLGADYPWEADPLDRAVSGAAPMRGERARQLILGNALPIEFTY